MYLFCAIARVHRHDTEDTLSSSNVRHKIVVMGAARVGKTSIITQFLYSRFSTKYKRTVEEMHQGDFSISGVSLTLDILDTSGSFEVRTIIVINHSVITMPRDKQLHAPFNYITDNYLLLVPYLVRIYTK